MYYALSVCGVCTGTLHVLRPERVDDGVELPSAAGELVRAAARRGPVSLQPLFQVGAREEFLEVVVLWA